jgi:hypothetical protein
VFDEEDRFMLRLLIILGGIALGIWHLLLAMKAIFLFKTGEPFSSWLAIVAGPCMTLPAIIVSCFKDKMGGILLIIGGLVSLISISVNVHFDRETIFPFSYMISAPMLAIGVFFLLTKKNRESFGNDVETEKKTRVKGKQLI